MMSTQKQVIADRLEHIASLHGGRITPDLVIKDAKSKDSPLHSLFEWDKSKAAHQHWLDTARSIIASVEVRVTTEHITVRTPIYVRDPSAAAGTQGYIAVSRLRSEPDLAREALVAEFQHAADLLRRARHLAIALSVEDDVDEIVEQVVDLRERVRAEVLVAA